MKHFFFPSPFFSVQFEQEDFEKFHFSRISREDWANMIPSNEKRELGVDRHEAY